MVTPAKLAIFTNRLARICPAENWINKSSRDSRYDRGTSSFRLKCFLDDGEILDPFKAPEPLPIQNPSNFVPKNGFPVAKGFIPNPSEFHFFFKAFFLLCIPRPWGCWLGSAFVVVRNSLWSPDRALHAMNPRK